MIQEKKLIEAAMLTKELTNYFTAALILAALNLSTPCAADEWQKPWSSVQSDAARKCAKIFNMLQMQSVCMENEKDGYEKMQGNFDLPVDIVAKAKENCEKVFDMFQMQAVCMQNEKDGYEKMKKY
jgi:hypothetical protein